MMVVVVRVVLLMLLKVLLAVASTAAVDDAAPVQPRIPRPGLLVSAAATDVHATAAVETLPA